MSPTSESDGRRGGAGLAHDVLGAAPVLGQAVANVGPSAVTALLMAVLFGLVGPGAWASWLLTGVAALLVGYCIAVLARRFTTAGSLYSYVGDALGPHAGFVAGAAVLFLYLLAVPALMVAFAIFAGDLLIQLGAPVSGEWAHLALYLGPLLPAAVLAYRDVRVSTTALLVLEIVSMGVITVLLLIVVVKHGGVLDRSQLTLAHSSMSDILKGVTIGFFGLAGFESAANLGLEARDPRRAIPRMLLLSVVVIGVFYVFNAYAQALGFTAAGTSTLASATNPLAELAERYGLHPVAYAVNIGLAISAFAAVTALLNSSARFLYTMGREGRLPAALGRTHPRHRTPHVAVGVIVGPLVVAAAVMAFAAVDAHSLIAWLGTLGGYGILLAYFLVAVGMPVVLARDGKLRAVPLLIAVAAATISLAVFIDSVYTAQEMPYTVFPYLFVGYALTCLAVSILTCRTDGLRPDRPGRSSPPPSTQDGVATRSSAPARPGRR
ncbi:MAG: APC family permease [Acidimicrobiales bacterium]